MKIAVVGPGAVGCLFTSFFAAAGKDVVLLDKSPERAAEISREGISVVNLDGTEKHYDIRATADAATIGARDLVFICVKAPDTSEAARNAMPLVGNDTAVATLQNGLGNIESIAEVVGSEHTLGGTTAQGATLLGTGRVRHAGNGETVIGEMNGTISERAGRIRDMLEECGLKCRITDNLEGLIWSKLIINVGINALTALTRMRNGKLVEYEGARAVMRDAVDEAVRVATKLGIELQYEDAVGRVEEVCRATAENISSMFQDVLRKRGTEVDCINGAVAMRAVETGIYAPVNATLTRLVRTLQEGYADQVESL